MSFPEGLQNLKARQIAATEVAGERKKGQAEAEREKSPRELLRKMHLARPIFTHEVDPIVQQINEYYLDGEGVIEARLPENTYEEDLAELETQGPDYLGQINPIINLSWIAEEKAHHLRFIYFAGRSKGSIQISTYHTYRFFELDSDWRNQLQDYVLNLLANPKTTLEDKPSSPKVGHYVNGVRIPDHGGPESWS